MSNEQEKEIYSGIYGGFKRTEVQILRTVRCEKYSECSLYKNGKCAGIPMPFAAACPFSKRTQQRGYSKMAMKYDKWSHDIKARESYLAVNEVTKFVAKVGNDIMSDFYCGIYWDKANNKWSGPDFFASRECSILPISDGIIECLYKLYKYIPRTIMENAPIKGWENERNAWFTKLNDVCPELTKAFADAYPDVDIAFTHVGRTALLKTLVDGTVVKNYDIEWSFNKADMKLTTESFRQPYISGMFKDHDVKMTAECPVTDTMKVTVESDAWVDSETVYVD